ncbi:hypothetical protein COCVIDRAFT_15361 [Bipolaris victoriae FI3]|uniref:Uncharacterized protein n=1 Tax=Bipolaris victoriae (strain FI3) TaxID=930091 RepID=W7EP61_BIPV3|nr:hypothetical protein COCVIDRAFT_15361 [Bipolaris victoriae FI3]
MLGRYGPIIRAHSRVRLRRSVSRRANQVPQAGRPETQPEHCYQTSPHPPLPPDPILLDALYRARIHLSSDRPSLAPVHLRVPSPHIHAAHLRVAVLLVVPSWPLHPSPNALSDAAGGSHALGYFPVQLDPGQTRNSARQLDKRLAAVFVL